MPREIREQENANFRKTLFSNFSCRPPCMLLDAGKGGFVAGTDKNFQKIFYAAKNRMYTNTPAAIWQNKIAGMPKRKYQWRVLW